jgi:hypothetical protein
VIVIIDNDFVVLRQHHGLPELDLDVIATVMDACELEFGTAEVHGLGSVAGLQLSDQLANSDGIRLNWFIRLMLCHLTHSFMVNPASCLLW